MSFYCREREGGGAMREKIREEKQEEWRGGDVDGREGGRFLPQDCVG